MEDLRCLLYYFHLSLMVNELPSFYVILELKLAVLCWMGGVVLRSRTGWELVATRVCPMKWLFEEQ